MPYRLLLFICLLWPASAQALDSSRARDAFLFAERRDWANALAHAKKAESDMLVRLITWQSLADADSRASFGEITRFIAINPGWPDISKLRLRAESALLKGAVDDDEIIGWFEAWPPISGAGKIAYARALSRLASPPKEKIASLAREAWRHGDFEEAQEKDILKEFGALLGEREHIARADRLLWEEKTAAAKRMLPLLPRPYQYLVEARRLLIKNDRASTPALSVVPKELKNDPGLTFNRIQYRARRNDDKGVRELLVKAPPNLPYPEKWWRYREAQVRAAIGEGEYGLAATLLANHEQLSGTALADAAWLSGWLQLEFLKQPKTALATFTRMYGSVSFPVSRSRAAFWAGRAAAAAGDGNAAANWYATASAWPTTFYGQLASHKRRGAAALKLPGPPEITEEDRGIFENNELAQAARLSLRFKQYKLAEKLISFLVETSADVPQVALAAAMGADAGYLHLGVRGAKKASQRSIALTGSAYPQPPTQASLPVERALTLAIARQESEFNREAVSPAGALGLMQIMPATAKEMARKTKTLYSKNRLFEAEYNMRLGSEYLSRLIKGYDGSYVLAVAAYNAGPGNVRRWIRTFGAPGKSEAAAINWIEEIPFAETRNYVQRVLENLQVYRQLEGSGRLEIAEDLVYPRRMAGSGQ